MARWPGGHKPKNLGEYSGVLGPGSLTKIVILVLGGNASLDSAFTHNFVWIVRQNHEILIMLIKFSIRMCNTKWSGKVT